MDLELATNALLADTRDVRMLVTMLARTLVSTLGERVEVEREGGLFRKSDEVRSLRLTIGAKEYSAQVVKGAVDTAIGHNSAGIRIRSERVGMRDWLNRLLQDLREEAVTNQDSKMAIESIVMGGLS
jgi:hypothetical protein